MGQAGYLLRFVDIVLILLFGFICISSIDPSPVDPPESSEVPKKEIERNRIVYVDITDAGEFIVEDGERTLGSLGNLQEYLLRRRQEAGSESLKVRLRSGRTAPILYLMQAAKLCDDMGITKSMEVEVNRSR